MWETGLAGEREKTDHALSDKVAVIEQRVDAVVERACAKADQVLDAARVLADERLRQPIVAEAAQEAIHDERAREEAIVLAERASRRRASARARAATAPTTLQSSP